MSDPQLRAEILRLARDWLDTPYRHQASVKGAGTDCLGLIRGIWRELYGAEPETPPAYTPDWAEQSGEETLRDAAARWLTPIATPRPGDALLFRMTPTAPCKHIGILSAPDTLLHAYWGKAVVESHLVPFWQRRHVASFAFPPLSQE
ncbi:NlpC/P60 family protein [Litorimonas sp. WD9-15]|uniref:NlpC/P60 family protein n=1 Tax=Litorimonas sp. WD9-15 TaxID=3418716 RepID=UPI003D08E0F6